MPIYKQIAEFIEQKDNVGTLPRIECPGGGTTCTNDKKEVKAADEDVLKQLIQDQYDKIRSTYQQRTLYEHAYIHAQSFICYMPYQTLIYNILF